MRLRHPHQNLRGKPDPFIGAGIVLSIILFLWYVYPGFWSPLKPHFEGTCRALPLSASAEDMVIDSATGLLYLTYYDRVPRDGQEQTNQGSVMMVDLNAAEPRVRAALAAEIPGMEPAGVSLYAPETGPKRLFVVSLSEPGKHSVEIFEQSPTGAFTHSETLRDPLLWSPVAIVAVGPRQFYATNDAWQRDDRGNRRNRGEERRAPSARPGIVYFDGERMRQVAPRVPEGIGVDVSRDGKTIYIAEASGSERLLVYDRDLASGELNLRERVPLLGAPHNVTVDAADNLWITAHPKWFSYTRALVEASARSPTQVLKFSPRSPVGKRVTEVYLNRGDEISTGTVAAVHKNQLIIGSITDHKLLLCDKPGLSPPEFSGPEKDDT
jgi:arylesterase/paraoxonase